MNVTNRKVGNWMRCNNTTAVQSAMRVCLCICVSESNASVYEVAARKGEIVCYIQAWLLYEPNMSHPDGQGLSCGRPKRNADAV